MNLRLYKAVLGRFRWLVLAGLLLAVVLALFSYVRVSFDNGVDLTYRQQEVWESTATLLVTDRGFQLGRDPRIADPFRFTGLAVIYARLASIDEVRQLIVRKGEPISGTFFAGADVGRGEVALPTITTFGHAPSPSAAKRTVRRGTEGLIRYLKRNQSAASIPPSERVRLRVLSFPSQPRLLVPRKNTLLFVVFLAVLTATIGLAFVLENVRPRAPGVRVAAEDPADVLPEPGVRVVAEEPANGQPEPHVEAEEDQGVTTRRWA